MKTITKRTKVTIPELLCALKDLEYRYRDSGCMPSNKKYVPKELKNAWKLLDNARQLDLPDSIKHYLYGRT